MPAVSGIFKILRSYGPRVLFSKAAGRTWRTIRRESWRIRDCIHTSHGAGCDELQPQAFELSFADVPNQLRAYLLAVTPAWLEHRFSMLGADWVHVAYGVECAGLAGHRFPAGNPVNADIDGKWLECHVNRANRREARRIWQLINQDDYVPIDWQLDFKSGYRWDARTYHSKVRIGPAPGADIKLPRELARMQHLPLLAVSALLAFEGDSAFAPAEVYVHEIRAQLLDFISTNSPRYGVNWACAMDVAIRVANWLLTLDLLATAGLELEPEAKKVLARSVEDHANYIAEHLEWSECNRTNHYLSGLVGLLYAAARLRPSPRNDAWLAFAVRELMAEAEVQFHTDGSCYEGSTSYHRLSSELLLFGVALSAGVSSQRRKALLHYSVSAIRVRPPFLPAPVPMYPDANGQVAPVPPSVVERLWRAARFTEAISRPDGRIVQIGDTDSGRLFWLHPAMADEDPPTRDDLNHAAFVEAVDALFDLPHVVRWFDSRVVRALARDWRPLRPAPQQIPPDHGDPGTLAAMLEALPPGQRRLRRFPLEKSGQAWHREAFPAFGIYLFRRKNDFLAFRCVGPTAWGVPDGHRHDDNLGIEMMLGDELVIADPGTWVYTADKAGRNRYRSADAHDVPRALDWAVAPPGRALFSLKQRAYAKCLCWKSDAVAARIKAPEGVLYRLVRFGNDNVEILDAVSAGELAPLGNPPPVCEGYGCPI